MAIQLVSITYRSTTRVRLCFSAPLAAGAFNVAHYAVDSLDSYGADPEVRAALLVVGQPELVELALGAELVPRAQYQVVCTAVPGAVGTYSGTLVFDTPGVALPPSAAIQATDASAALYGLDLVWNGEDIAEAANGDLAVTSGLPNAQSAIRRCALANGLPWDPEYGGMTRGYVDAPQSTLPEMVGRLQRAIEKDDRVVRALVKVDGVTTSGDVHLTITGTLIGDNKFSMQQDISRR